MSTKIYPFSRGVPSRPAFAIRSAVIGSKPRVETLALFGRTLYSPRHHIDMNGRPIPVRRSVDDKHRVVYGPSLRPAIVHPLDAPAPALKRR